MGYNMIVPRGTIMEEL